MDGGRSTLDFGAVFDASPDAYMVLDRDLRYVAANRAYLRATASRRGDLIGRHVLEAFPHDPEDPANESARQLRASLEKVLATGEPDALPMIRYRVPVERDGERRTETSFWSATHTPIHGDDGATEFIVQHTVNVTRLARTHDAPDTPVESTRAVHHASKLLDAQQQLFQVFEQSSSFLCYLRGPRHVFELVNPALQRLVGAREVVGHAVADVLPEVAEQGFVDLLDRTFATAEPYVGEGVPVALERRPGEPAETRYVDFVFQPIADETGEIAGILVEGRDVTAQKILELERRAVEEALRASEGRLRRVVAASRVGTFEVDLPDPRVGGDDLFGAILEAEAEAIDPALAMERVHLDDRARVRDAAERAFAGEHGGRFRSEHRLSLPGATRDRWVEVRAQVEFDDDARPRRFLGTIVDVTDRKEAELEVSKLASVLDASHDFVGISDLEGNQQYVNLAGLALVGLDDLEAARTTPVVEYFAENHRARARDVVLPTALREGFWEGELAFRHVRTGESIPVLYSVFTLRDAAGRPIALAAITRDLRAQKEGERERARLLEAETTARAQAEEASRLKDEFLATVSHELRTPLSAILGWTHLLRSGEVPAERIERALATIDRNARLQAQLIDDLLDVSRVMSGKLALERAPLDVSGVVAAAVESIRTSAGAKGVGVTTELETSGTVLGDVRRLEQILGNLLSNAVKFTPGGGSVRVAVRRVDAEGRESAPGPHVEVIVRDDGIGISSAFLPHVFEAFRQAEGGASRRSGGLGLGLAIVRHLAEMHGGAVTAESDGPGKGATFTLRLPVASESVATPEPAREDARGPRRSVAGLRVLVVDDEADTRDYVGALLGTWGADATLASSASQALATLARVHPDVLVSDLAMPEEDGYSLIERVRALAAIDGGETPAVALSAYARAEDRARAVASGFQRHVAKPIDPGELLDALASLAP